MTNNDMKKEIKELPIKKRLSQEELANLSGLSLRTIQRIEKGETNALGDTKRKIIKILETYPDLDFCKNQKDIEKKNFLQKIGIKYEYPLIIYIFSLFVIFIGYVGITIFIKYGLITGFLSLIVISISTVNHLRIKGFKKGIKYFIISVGSIFVYLFAISFMIPVKTIKSETKNGMTKKIERNLITKKSDTLITNQ